MNQNKFNSEGSNHANFAKKATLATITAMAALTLAACGNNDAGAKPAGSSEPKTEQSAKKLRKLRRECKWHGKFIRDIVIRVRTAFILIPTVRF